MSPCLASLSDQKIPCLCLKINDGICKNYNNKIPLTKKAFGWLMVSEQDSGFYLFVHSISEILLNLLSLFSDIVRSKWFFVFDNFYSCNNYSIGKYTARHMSTSSLGLYWYLLSWHMSAEQKWCFSNCPKGEANIFQLRTPHWFRGYVSPNQIHLLFWTFWTSKFTNFKTRLWTRDMCHVYSEGTCG